MFIMTGGLMKTLTELAKMERVHQPPLSVQAMLPLAHRNTVLPDWPVVEMFSLGYLCF